MFAPLGGSQNTALFCAPWADWQGKGTTARPAKGDTAYYTGVTGRKIPPLYRNPAFFTAGGEPNTTSCTAASTGATPGGKGKVQAGNPIVGPGLATTTTGGAVFVSRAPTAPAGHGMRVTGQLGEFAAIYPYVYSYTYATLRNNLGFFGPGSGPGDFSIVKKQGANPIARMRVKAGVARFGGTMTMLGALTSKVCYYRNGGCSIGSQNWRYDAIGISASTSNGVVTNGQVVTSRPYYYCPAITSGCGTTLLVEGSRFPWTTGAVTVTAVGRGPHKTVHDAHGYDNRAPTSGRGTIQLVSPTLTRWLQPAVNFETGGIGILKIKFHPYEPPDRDLDGIPDENDNCSEAGNPLQDDTDGDHCGNLCDADYDNSGTVGFVDFGLFAQNFATTNALYNHTEPVDDIVGFRDFGFFSVNFGTRPGLSGTTQGTTACL